MLSTTKLTLREAFDLYESGKHRRYSLLFSVNGGAFAIAKLFADEPGRHAAVLGNLTLAELAVGMTAFTVVMASDIYAFGEKMRANFLKGAFGRAGKAVLILLAVLLCMGWFLVGMHGGRA
jgi:hypothetical protein